MTATETALRERLRALNAKDTYGVMRRMGITTARLRDNGHPGLTDYTRLTTAQLHDSIIELVDHRRLAAELGIEDLPKPDPKVTPVPTPTPKAQPTPAASAEIDDATRALEAVGAMRDLMRMLGSGGAVNADAVRAIVAESIEPLRRKIEGHLPTRVSIVRPDLPDIDVGIQHSKFPTLLKVLSVHSNVWLWGPPGTGKTTACEALARALERKFYCTGAVESKYDMVGFARPDGAVFRTPFRDWYEHGGVFLWDEVDRSSPQAVCAVNAAIENGFGAFPDGTVRRHKDALLVCAANTPGNGGGSKYAGAMRQDGAFLNRFAVVDWPICEALEAALCPDANWLVTVRKMRAAAAKRGMSNTIVTPRASIIGAKLLAVGLSKDEALEATCRAGLEDSAWSALRNEAGV